MLSIGQYRLVLHPTAEPETLEAQLSGTDTRIRLQLTRVTTGLSHQLLRASEPAPDHWPAREYVWQVSVTLMSTGVRYAFEENLERIQEAVKDHATVLGVDVLDPVNEEPVPAPDPPPEPVIMPTSGPPTPPPPGPTDPTSRAQG